MKKILFMLVLLIPFIVYAEYDESKVTIESLIKTKTEGYGKEINSPRINGNNINLEVQFTEVDDSVTYDITIKNESGEDIELYNKLDKSDYVDYTLMAPDLDYVVKNGSSKTFQLQVEYAHAVPESAADEGIYYDNKVYSLEVSNELGRDASALGIEEGGDTHDAVDPTPTSTDVPATVDNPNTKAVKNVLVIVCIIFVISIGLFLILRKKNRIGKVFVIVGLIGIITPLVVFAYKDFKINFTTRATILVGIVEDDPVVEPIPVVKYPNGKTKETVVTGDLVTIGEEQFYVVKHDGNDLILLARYNLKVGVEYDSNHGNVIKEYNSSDDGYGIQNSQMRGWVSHGNHYGGIPFSSNVYWADKIGSVYSGIYCDTFTYTAGTNCAYVYDSNSNLKTHVDSYKAYLEDLGASIKSARLLRVEEAFELGCGGSWNCNNAPAFLKETSFWLGSAQTNNDRIWVVYSEGYVYSGGSFNGEGYSSSHSFGVRPVIVI